MSQPAARLTDMHVCPQITVLVPHVGGPIAFPGEPRVLIGGLPAARVGDFCVCVGPPDVIAMGSFTVLIGGKPAARMGDMTAHGGAIVGGFPQVLIGDAGGGAGSPAAFTMAKARATGAAFTRTTCPAEGVMEQVKGSPLLVAGNPLKKSWIEIELVDQKGKPVPHERYRVVPPGGPPIEGFLDDKGLARITGIDPGTCTISFPDIDGAAWKPASGDPGRLTRKLPETRIIPSIGPATLTRIPGPGVPSIGPVTFTGVLPGQIPSVGEAALTVIPGIVRPSIGPVQLTVTPPIVPPIPLKQPGVRLPTISLHLAGEPYIVDASVRMTVKKTALKQPGVKLQTITVRPTKP